MKLITLVFRSRTVQLGVPGLSGFNTGRYPRERLQGQQFGRAATGTLYKEGPFYELPHIWTIDVTATPEIIDALDTMHEDWLQTTPLQYVELQDTIQRFKEKAATPTRPIVPGTTVQDEGGGMISYFPIFNVIFTDTPSFAKEGASRSLSMQLEEGIKRVAA
ncbi:MAG: hypothetical protein AAFY26_08270 [Cyanobacteria bacterium J06638_22]